MPKKKRKPETEETEYMPTAQEQTALDKFFARKAESENTAPRIKLVSDGTETKVTLDHPNQSVAAELFMEALGTTNVDFANGILSELIRSSTSNGAIDVNKLNFMLSVVTGYKPRDQLEAMLVTQTTAVHCTGMTFAERLGCEDNLQQQDSDERAFNKLFRTFTTQMEALKRYRTGGEQKVTVQHVSVGEGGQAIVGNVTQNSPKESPDKIATSRPALTHSNDPPMPPVEENKKRILVPAKGKSREK
jgi:hypothetical protein